jgi:predicted nucleic acid-binding Zn ribbon protein
MANKRFPLKRIKEKLMLDEFEVGLVISDDDCFTWRDGVKAFWKKNDFHYLSMNKYVAHKCGICGEYFLGNFSGLYCSKDCKKKARQRNNANFRKRKTAEKIAQNPSCIVCGVLLSSKRSTKKYCSNRCRQAFYRKQKSCKT